MGNICRSPAGECVTRHLAEEAGVADQLHLESAGTIGFHTGKSPDARMIEAAQARGITIAGAARQVQPSDFENFDWIVAMDQDNYDDLQLVREQATGDQIKAQLVMLCDYCQDHSETEVPDPYYGGPEGFEKVLDLLEDGCAQLIQEMV